MTRYLFFDLEASGLKGSKSHELLVAETPDLYQVGFVVTDEVTVLARYSRLVKAVKAPEEQALNIHNITLENTLTMGVSPAKALAELLGWAGACNYIIAYGLKGDAAGVRHALLKAGINPAAWDTMVAEKGLCMCNGPVIKFCGLEREDHRTRGFRRPGLDDLHMKLFGVGVPGAHDALNDAEALGRCYFALKAMQIDVHQ